MKWIITMLWVASWGYAQAQDADSLAALGDVRTLTSAPMADRATGTRGSRAAQRYLEARFRRVGVLPLYHTYEQPFFFAYGDRRIMGTNILGYVKGTRDDWIIVAAHYDYPALPAEASRHPGGPQTPDNAAGVAVLLALASRVAKQPAAHNILFIAFDAAHQGGAGVTQWTTHHSDILSHVRAFISLDGIGRGPGIQVTADTLLAYVRAAAAETETKVGVDTLTAASRHTVDQAAFQQRGIPSLVISARAEADDSSLPALRWLSEATGYTAGLLRLVDQYLGIRLPPKSKWIMDRPAGETPPQLRGPK